MDLALEKQRAMRRRHLLALIAASAAAPIPAFADDQRVALAKAFPMLEQYLGVPPAARSRFYLAYRAVRDKRPAADARAAIVGAGGAAVPLALDRAGVVTRLPTLAELKGPAELVMQGQPFKLGLELRCAMAPSTHIDPIQLEAALAQVNAAVAKIAGALAMMVPKLTTAFFPDAGGGHALFADGRQTPLPVYAAPIVGPVPFFEPAKAAGAKAVVLARAPSRILLGGHPKGA
jgi:hypothetical protein